MTELFNRGELSCSGDNSDWDDTELIKAYDRAISDSKKQIAERLNKSISTASDKLKKGSHCRAVYDADNVEYEALIDSDHGDFVTVTFLGYGNSQRVRKRDLKTSGGAKARRRQRQEAEVFNAVNDEAESLDEDNKERLDYAAMEDLTFPPPPPFPPHVMKKMGSQEQDALNAMLMSWYMSGYYTGYYQGIKSRSSK